jgi:hypothetical protein
MDLKFAASLSLAVLVGGRRLQSRHVDAALLGRHGSDPIRLGDLRKGCSEQDERDGSAFHGSSQVGVES